MHIFLNVFIKKQESCSHFPSFLIRNVKTACTPALLQTLVGFVLLEPSESRSSPFSQSGNHFSCPDQNPHSNLVYIGNSAILAPGFGTQSDILVMLIIY